MWSSVCLKFVQFGKTAVPTPLVPGQRVSLPGPSWQKSLPGSQALVFLGFRGLRTVALAPHASVAWELLSPWKFKALFWANHAS